METLDMVLCKVVATEVFPDRGWIGVVAPAAQGHQRRLAALLTRPELYKVVGKIMRKNGEDEVRKATRRFVVPDGYELMFASVKDAQTTMQAKHLIEKHLSE